MLGPLRLGKHRRHRVLHALIRLVRRRKVVERVALVARKASAEAQLRLNAVDVALAQEVRVVPNALLQHDLRVGDTQA
jgi:hypothetical protein